MDIELKNKYEGDIKTEKFYFDIKTKKWVNVKPGYFRRAERVKNQMKSVMKRVYLGTLCAVMGMIIFMRPVDAKNEINALESVTEAQTTIETQISTPRGQIGQEPEWLTPLIYKTSDSYGVPAGVIAALIRLESASSFDPEIKGDYLNGVPMSYGLGQIYISLHGVTIEQATDPEFAVDWIGRHLIDKYRKWGTWYQALQSYNGGDGAIYGSYSHGYADRICREAGLY